jgi:uncharacterized protein (DUF1330 family)
MAYYFLANIRITDEEGYGRYLEGVDGVFSKFRGEYLAVDTEPEVLEGEWTYSKVVLIKFPGKAEFDAWYYSESYQDILRYRFSSSVSDSLLLRGFDE